MILRYSSLHLKLSSTRKTPYDCFPFSLYVVLFILRLPFSFFLFLVLSIVLSFAFSSLVCFRSLSFSTRFILSRPCSFFLYLFNCVSLLLSFCFLVLPPSFRCPSPCLSFIPVLLSIGPGLLSDLFFPSCSLSSFSMSYCAGKSLLLVSF